LRWVSGDGFTVLVGRNSRQNEMVTFQRAARGDLWLHARDVPGGHVIVKAAGAPVPERTVLAAAALAAWFSRARGDAAVAVAVTDIRHVKRLAGGGPGMVKVLESETRTVAPRSPEALQAPSGMAD
jgi:predicted ribosome quality control (RQC) complex YloA/Tae2 family protein